MLYYIPLSLYRYKADQSGVSSHILYKTKEILVIYLLLIVTVLLLLQS